MYKENNNGPRTVPWGTPDTTGAQSDLTVYHYTLLSEAKKSINPIQCCSTYSITEQCSMLKINPVFIFVL